MFFFNLYQTRTVSFVAAPQEDYDDACFVFALCNFLAGLYAKTQT